MPRSGHEALDLRVQGMRCDNCASSLQKKLETSPAIRNVKVSFALEEARLRFDPDRISPRNILELISDAGYEAHAIRDIASAVDEAEESDEVEMHEAQETRRRGQKVLLGGVLSLLIMGLGMGPQFFEWTAFPGRLALMCALAAVVQFYNGWEFLDGAWRAARNRTTNMDTLVALGSLVAFTYSFAVLLLGLDRALFPIYFESAAMIITLVGLGKFLEMRGKRSASGAVRALLHQQPDRARVLRDGMEYSVRVEDVALGETVLVRPGEKVAVDGRIVSGGSHLDEAMLTGESAPIAKERGDSVFAGTMNVEGAFQFEATAVGDTTVLADIVRLVREAQATRAPIQKTVDRIAHIFVPTMIAIALGVGLGWGFWGAARYFPEMHPIAVGLLFGASTLLISCPCAMGLATPLALIAGTGVGAEKGLLIKSAQALETTGRLDQIILDKTGTLTLGQPDIVAAHFPDTSRERAVLQTLAAVERESEHPLARSMVRYAEERISERLSADGFRALPGRGVEARVEGRLVQIGNRRWLAEIGSDLTSLRSASAEAELRGETSVFVVEDGVGRAHFAIGDPLDPSAAPALRRLRDLGMDITMLTGDVRAHAERVARELAIPMEQVFADQRPDEKARIVEGVRAEGFRVGMVGDGINDAPALATADVGIAIGSGTDVAIEAADIVLIRAGLSSVADAIVLSRKTLSTIRQNLFWAFGYNIAAIPLAAGLLVPLLGPNARLGPGIAALAMALSSLFVVTNSARLRRFDPSQAR